MEDGKNIRSDQEVMDDCGVLVELDKNAIHIDESYQRPPNKPLIDSMVASWSWRLCGVLSVARRKSDNKLYVPDGQNRTLAARQRPDIETLPCQVFESESQDDEAAWFLGANRKRVALKQVEQWEAECVAGDDIALRVKQYLKQAERDPHRKSGPYGFNAIGTLKRLCRNDDEMLANVWPLYAELCEGNHMHGTILKGMWDCERRSQDNVSLTVDPWKHRFLKIGFGNVLKAINAEAEERGFTSDKVCGDAIRKAVNRKYEDYIIEFKE